MKGIVLASHGLMAEGLYDSLTMFFSDNIAQIKTVCLRHEMGADDFRKDLVLAVDEVDSGEGVIIFCDMLGGTPANQALLLASDKVSVIAGMNMPMLMEYLAIREVSDISIEELIAKSKESMIDASGRLLESIDDEDDD